MISMIKKPIAIAIMVLALPFMMVPNAFAGPDDEAFVTQHANEALAILADKSLSSEARRERFRSFVDEVASVPRIARFVLGKYARNADPQALKTFTQTFRAYATGTYEAQLDNYSGQTITVTGSQDRKPGDSIVTSVITGGDLSEPVDVKWRILTRHGRRYVFDVQVFGIWLALQQRTEITAIIADHGGRIQAAIDALQVRIDNRDFATAEKK